MSDLLTFIKLQIIFQAMTCDGLSSRIILIELRCEYYTRFIKVPTIRMLKKWYFDLEKKIDPSVVSSILS